jgi:hypothetical protein
VSREPFSPGGAVVIAAIETGADVVAPPLERERPDVNDVTVFGAGAAQETIHA